MERIYEFGDWLKRFRGKGLSRSQKEFLDDSLTKGTWSYDEQTGKVDVNGSLGNSEIWNLGSLKEVRFGHVSGEFEIADCQIKSLEGFPETVGLHFYVYNNKRLKSLEGGPAVVGGNYIASGTRIINLQGMAQKIGESVDVHNTPSLRSLIGSPRIIPGNLDVSNCSLESFEGGPEEVGGDLDADFNGQLKSLKGAPKRIGGDFRCRGNNIESLEGAPEIIDGEILIGGRDSGKNVIIDMDGKDWNLQGWMRLLRNGTDEQKALIATLTALKGIQDNSPDEFDDFSDLADLGF